MAEENQEKKFESHVSKYKTKIVERFADLIKKYPIIGAVNMEGMPAPQLQNMRKKLKNVEILMTKRRLMKIAIEQCKDEKKGIEELEKNLKGMPALLFTEENPFTLFKTLKKNKSKAPAKAGQTAPNDIEIKAGPTPFAPGPVISELGALGLKTGVEEGKVAIKEDKVVVKEGEEIKSNVAGMLTRLGIEPMEIGLDLVAVYEDGVIYGKDVLDVDEEAFLNKVQDAARWAFNLAVEAGYYTKETINVLIPKAFSEAKSVALEGNIMCDMIAEELVQKAERQMMSLKNTANITDAPAKEESKEEKTEEKEESDKN